jgi:hypothetical protein
LKVLLGIPCPAFLRSKWLKRIFGFDGWLAESKNEVRVAFETTPNRMDRSISGIIQAWKDSQAPWGVRLDADILPETPFDEMLEYARQNWVRHHAITTSPTIDQHGVAQFLPVVPFSAGESCSGLPFEVEWISGSINFVPREVYDAFESIGHYTYMAVDPMNGRIKDARMEYYIDVQRYNTTEDVDFCYKVKEHGFKVFADPRLLCGQRRDDLSIPSFRKGFHFGENINVDMTP